jgi:hypothetical protein
MDPALDEIRDSNRGVFLDQASPTTLFCSVLFRSTQRCYLGQDGIGFKGKKGQKGRRMGPLGGLFVVDVPIWKHPCGLQDPVEEKEKKKRSAFFLLAAFPNCQECAIAFCFFSFISVSELPNQKEKDDLGNDSAPKTGSFCRASDPLTNPAINFSMRNRSLH